MRRLLGVVAGLVLIGIAAAAAFVFWPAGPAKAVAAAPVTPDLVARGQYIATAADCVACHTAPGGQPFAGGRAFRLPFGTIYSPNITSDRATGIGAWSDGEFLRAMHEGVGRGGEEFYPAFPYTSYHRMTEGDVLAVKAYLASLPAVRVQNRPNALSFPFDQRPLMRFWKLLFMPRDGFRSDASKPADWNRGAYLVTALGHCGECHTPRNMMYGLKTSQALSGETMQGWTAWNITSDPHHGVGAWSVDDLAGYFRYGYAPGKGAANGPMKEAIDFSLSKLTDADLRAMAVYLKSVPASSRGPAAGAAPPSLSGSTLTGPPVSETADAAGRKVFEGACASCHAWNGQGQETPMAALAGLPAVADPKGVNVMQTVLHGSSVTAPQGHAFMPSFGADYSNAEIAAVTNYVVTHFGGADGRAKPSDVAKARTQ
ncbi:cytochrome c [Phenylobacterium soli]|uniref:Cytochrome c n=1 Tax=Phenylobacterium soli TaxID=2170551 RepID=A0A328AJA6_9CAUL|nr:cytochrome c [Phenylobacterium soli]RAK54870.1 cytochrome c [Phenylobacterium soli]